MNLKLSTATVAVAIVAAALALPVMATPALAESHFGMCEASAAVPVGASRFVVGNDEDNTLRVYKREPPGELVYAQEMSGFLQIGREEKEQKADIEGATLIGNRVYWITSHSANKNGKRRPNRHRFFATDVAATGSFVTLEPLGKPFRGLVDALNDAPGLKAYHLGEAAKKAPESENGLNIEGLTGTPQGALLIGFRNPIPGGRALLVPLENPDAVITQGKQPELGEVILLELGGLGIRSIEYSDAKKAYIIVAGPFADTGEFQLYQWSGRPSENPTLIDGADLQGLHPEALVSYPEDPKRILVLSDDGSQEIGSTGVACKDLASPEMRFRSTWVGL